MREIIKTLVNNLPFYHLFNDWRISNHFKKKFNEWEEKGRQMPPPHLFKQKVLLDYKNRYKLNILVETGTYHGDMVWAMKKHFNSIISIELDKNLYQKAVDRFKNDISKIKLINGDSGLELYKIVSKITEPALFWLDGHYSGGITARGVKDTPIFDELGCVLSLNNRNVILIDDARCFGNDPSYPNLKNLEDFILSKNKDIKIEIKDDIIRLTSK